MGVGLGVNNVPIVGQPIAYGAGFIALLFVGFSTYIARYFYYYVTAGGSVASHERCKRGDVEILSPRVMLGHVPD